MKKKKKRDQARGKNRGKPEGERKKKKILPPRGRITEGLVIRRRVQAKINTMNVEKEGGVIPHFRKERKKRSSVRFSLLQETDQREWRTQRGKRRGKKGKKGKSTYSPYQEREKGKGSRNSLAPVGKWEDLKETVGESLPSLPYRKKRCRSLLSFAVHSSGRGKKSRRTGGKRGGGRGLPYHYRKGGDVLFQGKWKGKLQWKEKGEELFSLRESGKKKKKEKNDGGCVAGQLGS